MPDVITVILQGVDRLSGVADKATGDLTRKLDALKREMSDTERAQGLQNLLNDVKEAMDPGPAQDLQREYDKLKQNMSDTGAIDRFLEKLHNAQESHDADTAAVERMSRGIGDLDEHLGLHRRHLEEVTRTTETHRLSVEQLGREYGAFGTEVSLLEARLNRMQAAMGPAQFRNLRAELDRLLLSAGNTGDFDRFSQALDNANHRANASALNVTNFRNALNDARLSVSQMREEVSKLTQPEETLARDFAVEAENLTGLGDRVRQVRTEHGGFRQDVTDLAHGIDGLVTSVVRLGAAWVTTRIQQRAANTEQTSFLSTAQNLAQNVFNVLSRASRGFSSSLQGVNVLVTAAVVLFPVFTVIVQALAGVLVAAAGGAVALLAALSALVGLIVVIPAIVTAAIGAMGAFLVAFMGPITQIIQAVQFLRSQQAPGSSGANNTIQAAEKNLQYVRLQNANQLRDEEERYHDLVVHNRQQEADAQQNLNRVREQAAQRLLQAEQQLASIRKSNDLTRGQLEQNIAIARAALANADNETARRLASANVSEATQELNQFNVGPQGQSERQAQTNLTNVRKQNAQDIQDAEVRLNRTIRDNQRQQLEAEQHLQELRLSNTHQLLAAEKQLADARTGGTDAAAKKYRELSPQVKALAQQINQTINLLEKLTGPVRQEFFTFIGDLVALVRKNAGPLASILSQYGGAILGVGRDAVNTFGRDGTFRKALSTDFSEGAGGIRVAGDAIIHLAGAVAKILSQAKPLLDFLVQGFDNFGKWADNAADAGIKTGLFTRFFTAARDILKIVLDIFKNLFLAITNVFEVGFKPGEGLLQGIDDLTRKFKNFTDTAKGRNEIRHFFDDAVAGAKALAGLVGSIVSGIGKLGRDEIRPAGDGKPSGLVQGLNSASNAVPRIVQFIETFNQRHRGEVGEFIRSVFGLVVTFFKVEVALQPLITGLLILFNQIIVPILRNRVLVGFGVALLYAAAGLKGVLLAAKLAQFALGNLRLIGFLLLLEIVLKVIDHFKILRDLFNHIPGWLRLPIELLGTGGLYFAIVRLIRLLTGGTGLISVLGKVAAAVGEGEGLAGVVEVLGSTIAVALPAALVIAAAALGAFIGTMLRHIPAIRRFGDAIAGTFAGLAGLGAPLTDAQATGGLNNTNPAVQAAFNNSVRNRLAALRKQHPTWTNQQIMAELRNEGFARGGEVGGTTEGRAVRITAHIGEWVLNREQQLRMARLVGGWDSAKRYLFGTPVMRPKVAYASGGSVLSPFRASPGSGSPVSQTLQIFTSSPDVDIDYVMRIAGARLSGALLS